MLDTVGGGSPVAALRAGVALHPARLICRIPSGRRTGSTGRSGGCCPYEQSPIGTVIHRQHRVAEVAMNPPLTGTQKMPPQSGRHLVQLERT